MRGRTDDDSEKSEHVPPTEIVSLHIADDAFQRQFGARVAGNDDQSENRSNYGAERETVVKRVKSAIELES